MLKRYIDISGVDVKSDIYLLKPIFKSKGQCKLIYKDKPISYTRTRECILSKLKSVAPDLNLGEHILYVLVEQQSLLTVVLSGV